MIHDIELSKNQLEQLSCFIQDTFPKCEDVEVTSVSRYEPEGGYRVFYSWYPCDKDVRKPYISSIFCKFSTQGSEKEICDFTINK